MALHSIPRHVFTGIDFEAVNNNHPGFALPAAFSTSAPSNNRQQFRPRPKAVLLLLSSNAIE
jgi:hypothetical protein